MARSPSMTRRSSRAGTRLSASPTRSGISATSPRPGKPERIGELLGALNGVKHLIIGNNDGEATIREPAWASVQHYAELTVEGTALVLCHYPFRTWNKMGRGVVNLHGHSHGRLKPMPRQHDVGVDAWEYRPVPLATILAGRPRRKAA